MEIFPLMDKVREKKGGQIDHRRDGGDLLHATTSIPLTLPSIEPISSIHSFND
jgi:hypothetical protein